jgi:hypothetical protein
MHWIEEPASPPMAAPTLVTTSPHLALSSPAEAQTPFPVQAARLAPATTLVPVRLAIASPCARLTKSYAEMTAARPSRVRAERDRTR